MKIQVKDLSDLMAVVVTVGENFGFMPGELEFLDGGKIVSMRLRKEIVLEVRVGEIVWPEYCFRVRYSNRGGMYQGDELVPLIESMLGVR